MLDGHVQDVDGFFPGALRGRNKEGWGGRVWGWGRGKRAQFHPLASPGAAQAGRLNLAIVLRVEGVAGLAEERRVLGHVGEAGDDLIKVPGGTGQGGG